MKLKEQKSATATLFNGTMAAEENVVGFCHSKKHRGWISKNLLKKHQCVEKKCPSLQKTNRDYWEAWEARQVAKKENIEIKKAQKKQKKELENYVKTKASEYDNIYITNIKEFPCHIRICFISRKFVDLLPLKNDLRIRYGKPIFLKSIKTSPEIKAQLIRAGNRT